MRKETDLSGIKALGHAMLNTDIRLTAHSPMVVSHPFTSSGITGLRDSDGGFIIGNLLDNPDDLSKWRNQVGSLIDDAESAYDVFNLINKPYMLAFIKYGKPYLSEQDLGQILSCAWILNETPNKDPNMSKRELVSTFKAVSLEYLMDEEELQQYRELDDTVTIYRGVTSYNADNVKALSWTLSRETAEWFAHRFDEDGTVYEAKIDKKHICALFTGRNESEVIVDPKQLKDIIIAPEMEQEPTMTM